jgi:hypothetical protein
MYKYICIYGYIRSLEEGLASLFPNCRRFSSLIPDPAARNRLCFFLLSFIERSPAWQKSYKRIEVMLQQQVLF